MIQQTGGTMKVLKQTDDFLSFQFPEEKGFDYGFNICALMNGKKALLIDTAFRSQIAEVKKYLADQGLELTHVLASHFHNDHIAGLMHLPRDITVLGSPEYRTTLAREIPQHVSPVSFSEPFHFGNFTLWFTPAPGHSPCSILTDINGLYLHVGDNLMGRLDGRRILPWVERKHIESHISSLELLKSMNKDRIILAHGPILTGRERVAEEIDVRLFYLNALKNADDSLTIEKALPDNPENWVCKEFFSQLMEPSSDRK